jgi:hypothetical protein
VPKPSDPNIIYFRRPQAQALPYLVLVETAQSQEFEAFKTLDEALDYIEKTEVDIRLRCSLYQNVPLLEDED